MNAIWSVMDLPFSNTLVYVMDPVLMPFFPIVLGGRTLKPVSQLVARVAESSSKLGTEYMVLLVVVGWWLVGGCVVCGVVCGVGGWLVWLVGGCV